MSNQPYPGEDWGDACDRLYDQERQRKLDSEEQEYYVEWRIELDASSPEEAARKAREIQRDPDSIVTVFHVFDERGEEHVVDLEDIPE